MTDSSERGTEVMNNVIYWLKQTIGALIILFIFFGVICGCYWVAKSLSYALFYKDMVQETVRNMVKKEALK